MTTIITYDIPSKHGEFKELMFKLGYKDQIVWTNSRAIFLPNTTLYHATKNAETARDEAKSTANSLGVVLERCIATEWTNWSAIWGEPFK